MAKRLAEEEARLAVEKANETRAKAEQEAAEAIEAAQRQIEADKIANAKATRDILMQRRAAEEQQRRREDQQRQAYEEQCRLEMLETLRKYVPLLPPALFALFPDAHTHITHILVYRREEEERIAKEMAIAARERLQAQSADKWKQNLLSFEWE